MIRAVVLGVAAALLLAPQAGAAIVNVNCATQSLQAKIDAAAPGSTLRIKGTCVGRFTVLKNLTLDGNPHATLDGAQLGKTLSVIGTPTVLLTDLTITGGHYVQQNAQGGGIPQPGGNLTLRRVTVTGNTVGGTSATTGSVTGAGISSTSVGLAVDLRLVHQGEHPRSAPFRARRPPRGRHLPRREPPRSRTASCRATRRSRTRARTRRRGAEASPPSAGP